MEHAERDQDDVWTGMTEPVRRFIARRVRDSHTADDLAQDVMLKVQAALPAAPGDGDRLAAWMFQIARNTLADYYRSPRSRVHVPLDDAAELAASPEAEADVSGLSACLRTMVAKLPQPYREALELTELGELSQVELAARLGISVSGAKSRVQRGREQLKAMLLDCCRIDVSARGHVLDYETTDRSARYCGGGDGRDDRGPRHAP